MNNEKGKYLRDGRAPIPRSDVTSRVMSANKSKETGPEIQLQKALWKAGLRGYRKNWKSVPGKPDIAFVGKKRAIFVNGCFWHRCPKCKLPLPKSNKEFWIEKFERNKKRDAYKIKELQKAGWTVLVFWECEIKKDIAKIIKSVYGVLYRRHRHGV